jgi:hypothetical protein
MSLKHLKPQLKIMMEMLSMEEKEPLLDSELNYLRANLLFLKVHFIKHLILKIKLLKLHLLNKKKDKNTIEVDLEEEVTMEDSEEAVVATEVDLEETSEEATNIDQEVMEKEVDSNIDQEVMEKEVASNIDQEVMEKEVASNIDQEVMEKEVTSNIETEMIEEKEERE